MTASPTPPPAALAGKAPEIAGYRAASRSLWLDVGAVGGLAVGLHEVVRLFSRLPTIE